MLSAALTRWCKRDCPQKFASHVGDEITVDEVKEMAHMIGKTVWGEKSRYVIKDRKGERGLRWPEDRSA